MVPRNRIRRCRRSDPSGAAAMRGSIELTYRAIVQDPFRAPNQELPRPLRRLALAQDPFRPTSNLVHPGTSTMRHRTIGMNGVLLAPGPATSPMLTTPETAARAPLPHCNSFLNVHAVPPRRRPALPSSLPILALVQWRHTSSAGTFSIFARRWNSLGALRSGRRDGHVRAVAVSNPVAVFRYHPEHGWLIVACDRVACMYVVAATARCSSASCSTSCCTAS